MGPKQHWTPLTNIVQKMYFLLMIFYTDERKSHRSAWGWVNDDTVVIFGWNIPLKALHWHIFSVFTSQYLMVASTGFGAVCVCVSSVNQYCGGVIFLCSSAVWVTCTPCSWCVFGECCSSGWDEWYSCQTPLRPAALSGQSAASSPVPLCLTLCLL